MCGQERRECLRTALTIAAATAALFLRRHDREGNALALFLALAHKQPPSTASSIKFIAVGLSIASIALKISVMGIDFTLDWKL